MSKVNLCEKLQKQQNEAPSYFEWKPHPAIIELIVGYDPNLPKYVMNSDEYLSCQTMHMIAKLCVSYFVEVVCVHSGC